MIMKHLLVSFTLQLLLLCLASAQEQHDLLDPKLRDLFHEALSGELAKEHVIAISRHHRIQGSRGYRDAAHYVLGELRKYGYSEKDAYIESFKSDGIVKYQTWQSPSGWDISSAELRMVEPDTERIVGYPEIAMSVMTYSNTGDATAELVWVGAGTSDNDYKGKDVRGKFVLATGYGGSVHRLAVLKYGARAVVCYLDDERAAEYPDMLQYTGMWPRAEELGRVTFGFNLTNRQGSKLKNLLLAGKRVVLHGSVNGRGLEPYFMDVVVAHVRGTERPDEELVFSAHLDHPKESANDNASGSSAILDIARTLRELTENGRLPRPKRSFRFIWIPEFYGTMAYIDAHPELKGSAYDGKFLANMNMDMVGENLDLLHSHLILTRTPESIPSCVNDVVENMANMVDNIDVRTPRGSLSEFNYRITPYSGGSDHMMFNDRKIPGVMFSHTDYTHHTSEDTPDKVDPVELERCEIISLGTMWYLANLTGPQATELSTLVVGNAMKRLGHTLYKNRSLGTIDLSTALVRAEEVATEEIRSVATFYPGEDLRPTTESLTAMVAGMAGSMRQLNTHRVKGTETEIPFVSAQQDNRIPLRLTRGPLDFGLPESRLDSASIAWYGSKEFTLDGDMRYELVNFIDGKNTITNIRDGLSAEFKPTALPTVARYIEDLVKIGIVRWK